MTTIKFFAIAITLGLIFSYGLSLIFDQTQTLSLPILLKDNNSLSYLIQSSSWHTLCSPSPPSSNSSTLLDSNPITYYCRLHYAEDQLMSTRWWRTRVTANLEAGEVMIVLVGVGWSENESRPVLQAGRVVLLEDYSVEDLVLIRVQQPGSRPPSERMQVQLEHASWVARVVSNQRGLLGMALGLGVSCLVTGLVMFEYMESVFLVLEEEQEQETKKTQ